MRRRIVAGLAALALVGTGILIGRMLAVAPVNVRAYAQGRLTAVQVHLDEAPADYVFLAGDSHAELETPAQRPCGLELVNGGVSGASAPVYADLVATIRFPVRPRAAVLTIGTNDILAKNHPREAAAAARYEAAATRIIRQLTANTDRLVVTALPPIGRALDGRLDPLAVADYSDRLKSLCARLGCRFADPFAAIRDGATGFAKPGTMRDGLHLAAYRPVLGALAPALCDPTPP
ncbi:SGNH/GDSL hydrolase family protein [Methylobacterium sp. WL6]|uniref:SGNH/GDSL hydrolase family protein n=1 Tax=Methylobacterium sp. WL6 TaxID=2603901 RepID=UPI0011C808DB|nr:SGNH/GDSL hydrolase family protein [Methylobacterium sp. WL6]TXN71815.1 SGNH/GDSL hydrolase family protein [Methylobacterium sp. WL6]